EIQLDKGYIQVDAAMRTNEPNIFAIGDVIGGLQLAHVASLEGIVAVETIAGQTAREIRYEQVPRCTYTRPEVASVGISEREARERGHQVKTGKFSFRVNGKALVNGDPEGFVKMISDAETGDLLGVHLIGAHATDLISEAALAQVLNASAWEISQTIHPHPTLSEVIGEAALAVEGRAIHS
ncbi:MAG: lpd, partial [Bacilli bacterium]|nr:lpd [Bacilli bacterium]